MRLFFLALIAAAVCQAQQAEPEHRIRVSWDVAQSKSVVRPNLQCPPIAKTVHLKGVVAIEIEVDLEGKVRSTKVKSGHPMLTQAALDNIRQWRFEPMLVNGEKVVMETTAEIAPCGTTDAAYDKESKFRDEQIATSRECRARVQANDVANAEAPCKKALEMAYKIRGNTYLYENNALNNLGILRLQQQKPREAMEHFQEALKLLEANQKPDEAEIGDELAWIGIVKLRLGDDAGALPYLERAEKIFTTRIAGTEFEDMRNNYKRQLKSVREQRAGALEQLGRKDEAEAVRRLANE